LENTTDYSVNYLASSVEEKVAKVANGQCVFPLHLESLVGESGEGGRSLREGAAEGAGDSLWEVRLLRDAILKE
jgi:hypothetical protein